MANDELILRVAVAAIVISILAIAVRFWSRGLATKCHYSADEWLALLAWMIGLTSPAVNLADAFQSSNVKILKMTFANDILFHLGVGTSKLSALAFYRRIFPDTGVNRGFTQALWVTAGFCVAYMLFAVPINIWSCTPIRKFWHATEPGHCIDYYAQALAVAIWDTVLDVVILVLPMQRVFRLQMKVGQRILTAAAFVCGYCALVVSIGHLVASIKFERPGGEAFASNGVELAVWSELEVPIVIFSICLPSCFWLSKRLRNHGFVSLFSSKDHSVKPPLYHSPAVRHDHRGLRGHQISSRSDEGDVESVRYSQGQPYVMK